MQHQVLTLSESFIFYQLLHSILIDLFFLLSYFCRDKEEETPEPTITSPSANKDLEQVPDDNASGPTEEPQEIKPTPSEPVEPKKQEVSWSQKTFLENSRKYNLDLAPKVRILNTKKSAKFEITQKLKAPSFRLL